MTEAESIPLLAFNYPAIHRSVVSGIVPVKSLPWFHLAKSGRKNYMSVAAEKRNRLKHDTRRAKLEYYFIRTAARFVFSQHSLLKPEVLTLFIIISIIGVGIEELSMSE